MKLRSYITIVFCLLTFAIATIFLTSCVEKKSVEQEEASDVARTVPLAGTYRNLVSDEDISMADMKGYVLLIDFWATWCPPCRQEIPGFVELYDKYKDRKFAIIGISLDRGSTAEALVEKFIEEYGVNYPTIIATPQLVSEYQKAIGQPIRSIPTTLAVNKEGEIESVHVGFRPRDVFEREIQKLLGES